MMPEMDGFEFLDELRQPSRWRDIPVVVVTAKDLTAEERERLSRPGAQRHRRRAPRSSRTIAAAIGDGGRRARVRSSATADAAT